MPQPDHSRQFNRASSIYGIHVPLEASAYKGDPATFRSCKQEPSAESPAVVPPLCNVFSRRSNPSLEHSL